MNFSTLRKPLLIILAILMTGLSTLATPATPAQAAAITNLGCATINTPLSITQNLTTDDVIVVHTLVQQNNPPGALTATVNDGVNTYSKYAGDQVVIASAGNNTGFTQLSIAQNTGGLTIGGQISVTQNGLNYVICAIAVNGVEAIPVDTSSANGIELTYTAGSLTSGGAGAVFIGGHANLGGTTHVPDAAFTLQADSLYAWMQTQEVGATITDEVNGTFPVLATPGDYVGSAVALPLVSCQSVSVTNFTEFNDALTDYNDNCGNGDTLVVDLGGNTINKGSANLIASNTSTAVLVIQNGTLQGNGTQRLMDINPGNVIFQNMRLQDGYNLNGGGFQIREGGELTLINSLMTNNRGGSGGAINNRSGSLTLINTTITDNVLISSSNSSAVWSNSGDGTAPTFSMYNSIIANTTREAGGSGNFYDCSANSGTIVNHGPGAANLIETIQNNRCGVPGTDFIQADPNLNATTFYPEVGSPVIEAGDNSQALDYAGAALTTDLNGFLRVQNVNTDLGALETGNTLCIDALVMNPFALDAAIQDYNADCGNGADLIATVDGTITLINTLTPINNATTAELEIMGNGDDTLDGNDSFQILNIQDGDVTIDTMTLQNGNAGIDDGGAIYNNGTLTIVASTLTGNSTDRNGGAILSEIASSTTVMNSVLSNNQAQFGGGLHNLGIANISQSLIDNNETIVDGGGLYNFIGTMTIDRSTISNNTASYGGALVNTAALTVTNSTIFSNTANNSGAVIYTTGDTTLTNTTMSDNINTVDGAVYVSGVLNLNNSIIANTTGASAADCYFFSGVINFSAGLSNLIESDSTGGNACGTAGADYISADPLLGILQNNGGDVGTMALGAGSPAINAGNNASAVDADNNPLTTDARGVGFPRIVAGTVDLGAFESEQTTTVEFASATDSGVESVANPTILTLTTSDGEVSIAAITVELAVSGGTLTDDYTVTTPFTIPAGTASGTPFAIPGFAIVDDSVEEANETLTLTLSNPSGASLGTQTTMDYTILDDDRVPPAPFTADVLSVVVVPLEDASTISDIFYSFPATGDDVVLQGGQTSARVPVLSEILEASVPPSVGSSIGETAWRSLPGTPPSTGNPVDNRVTLYIDPNDLLGTAAFTVEDITSVEWRTNRQADTSGVDVDWYALEYTAVTEGGSTLSRITAETLYSPGGNPPSNNGTWQTWSTTTVPLFEPVQAGTNFGWYGNNVYQNDFFAGPIDWSLETNSGSNDTIDYRPEIINTIAVATASSWSDDLDGYIDYLVFNIDDGSTTYELIIDLEASPVPDEPTIEKAFGADTIVFGATTPLTFTLTNPNNTPLSGLAFSDTLPDNGDTGLMTFTSLTPAVDTCTAVRGITNVTADEISVSDVYLAGGASCEIVLEVQASEVGTYVNTSSALTTTTIGTAFGVGTDTAVATLEVVPPQATTVAFASATDSGPESVANPALLTVTTTDGLVTESDITVELAVSGGTVTDDYTVTTPFTIPAGTSPGTIAIPGFAIVDDTVEEPDETLTLTLSNPSGATLGAQTTIAYTIENDDDIEEYVTFLPIIMTPAYPDLIVEDVTVTSTDITVVIRNIGSAPVTDGFYVDAYLGLLNPALPPTSVNQIWQDISPQGVVWGVDAELAPIPPGGSLTLTLNDSYQLDAFSNFTMPLPSGTAVYIQVDSASAGNSNGGVLELHETNGDSYNNILGPVLAP